jgi:hypothetical protein
MKIAHITTNSRKKQNLAKYLCNCSVSDREKIIASMKTPGARHELRGAFHKAKALQILTWPLEIRRVYLSKLAHLDSNQHTAINNALIILELAPARSADHAENNITA